jgi:dGTP triphosphohydrolase
MENTAKKATAKAEVKAPNGLDKIAATAKIINTEVAETVENIANDIVSGTKEARTVATKSVKEVSDKLHVKENVSKIKATAKKVNNQIKATATELFEDVKTNAKEMQANANKMAIEAIENVNVTERVATLKKTAKNANEFALETAEELVEGFAVNGEKWQGIANKAVKNGLKLAVRQQDIMFSTLETVKGQLMNSANRFKNIIKN